MQNMMVAINKHEQTLQTKAIKALMISGLRSRDMAEKFEKVANLAAHKLAKFYFKVMKKKYTRIK